MAVKCRNGRRAFELFNEEDSFHSKSVDPALATYIETLQPIRDNAWEVLETSAKSQKEWDLTREVAINTEQMSSSSVVAA